MSESKLPPLNALRAFEAAARHLSLSKAADELHVTPAAVSHQVKALEQYLGVQLFRRASKGLLLTDSGQACLPGLTDGFARMRDGIDALRRLQFDRPLVVSVAPTFGARWLVPRLDRFSEAHPEIDIRIDASMRMVDLNREDVDLAVRFGTGDYPGMRVELLLDEEVAPVCSPRLLDGPAPIKAPGDLCRHTLIHALTGAGLEGYPDWAMWLKAAGVTECDPRRGPTFSLANLAVQAAIEGQGVALVGGVLAEDDILAGRLVRPFEFRYPVPFAYWIVCPEAVADEPRIAAFRAWLAAEAGRAREPR